MCARDTLGVGVLVECTHDAIYRNKNKDSNDIIIIVKE